jgi:hypoxanthine phosphoribosyltransferase
MEINEIKEVETADKIHYTFNDIEQYIKTISSTIINGKYNPNKIVTLAKGGLIPSRLLARELKINEIYSVGLSCYEDKSMRTQVHIYQPLSCTFKFNDKILVVDDIIDTGESIKALERFLKLRNVIDYKICSIIYKKKALITPDYYAKVVPDNQWVVFPWE